MSDQILVTGAAGFIGFHTVLRLLQAGHKVVGVDNLNDYYDVSLKQARLQELSNFSDFTFVKEDVANKEGMETLWRDLGPFRRVIHLAAQAGVRYSLKNPYSYIQSNIVGHLVILEMCRHTENFEHLVYASSSSVYGGNEKLPYAVEDRVESPVSLYAATKKSGELMSHSYSYLYDIPQTGLRFFTVYGPWGRPDMSPIIFAKAISAGEKVPVFNHGDMKRDFTYIDDIVSGVLAVLDCPPESESGQVPQRVLNIGNTKSENLMDFIAVIEKALGQKADIDFLPMQPGDVKETYADVSETTRIAGYSPTTSIEEGIPKFVDWFQEYYGE
ncbi:MAG: NAD-dependent epimerase/dehydratase family protein [Alphaproteobacteria bacterium]